jgi:hypothetical protein
LERERTKCAGIFTLPKPGRNRSERMRDKCLKKDGHDGTKTTFRSWSIDCNEQGRSLKLPFLGSPYGLDASRISFTCFGNTAGSYTGGLHLFDEPNGNRANLASSSDCQPKRGDPHDGDQVGRLISPRFLFRNPIPGFFFLSPDFLPALCLNSPYRGFPKGDSSEAHLFSFRRSILSVDAFGRTTSAGPGSVEQSIHAACIEAPSQSPPLKETWRQTPAQHA